MKKKLGKLTKEDKALLRRKLQVGTRVSLTPILSANALRSAMKYGRFTDSLLSDYNLKGGPDHPLNQALIRPASEALGSIVFTKKILDKLKKDTQEKTAGIISTPLNIAMSYGVPTYQLMAGQKSLGESVGSMAGSMGGAALGRVASKALDPLINMIPYAPIRTGAKVIKWLGEGMLAAKGSELGSNLGKQAPIYNRPEHNRIQHYNETGEII